MRIILIAISLLLALPSTAFFQDCTPPPIVFNSKTENIFTPEQEKILGELSVENLADDLRPIDNAELLTFVENIGKRLAKYLPHAGFSFKFYIVDTSEANAYTLPGGNIFLSRKLIAFAENEDEIAGVMAHELGHAVVHHSALDFSVLLRKLLRVESVGDRKDITEKYNLVIENARTKKISRKSGHEDNQQLEADRIGMFAMVAAGYDSAAFSSMFERLTESKGKGNWLSDLFGKTTPDQKRLREMAQLIEKLPSSCREARNTKPTGEFLRWQADVVSFRPQPKAEHLPGLIWKKDISPKLRSDISRIILSRDGRYIVTRDDFALTVLEREPLKVLFQITAEDVENVYITADSKYVVFDTIRLRFEKWSIVEQAPVETRELAFSRDCLDTKLSFDGRFLACIDSSLSAIVVDLRTGKRVFEKKEFYEFAYWEYWRWAYAGFKDAFRVEFTPDSGVVLFSRSNYFRVMSRTVGSPNSSRDATLAVDLTSMKRIDLGGDIDQIAARAYIFKDSRTILGMSSSDTADGGIFSFPEGKRLQKFTFFAKEIEYTGNPNYYIIKPLKDSKIGIFDAQSNQLSIGLDKVDATIWNDQVIFESVSGRLMIRALTGSGKATSIGDADLASVEIPVAAIGNLRTAHISNSFQWLTMSSRTRGGVWDLATGARKVYTPGFRGGLVADDGAVVAEFPKYEKESHGLVLLNPMNGQMGVIRELPESGAAQYGRFVLLRTSLKPKNDEKKSDKQEDTVTGPVFDKPGVELWQNTRFEIKDLVTDKVVWARDFFHEVPGYTFDAYSGRLMFYWRLGSDAGKSKLKEDPEFKQKADALGNKENDYLMEVVDAFAAKVVGRILIETGKGSFNLEGGLSEGKWLVFYDSEGRILVYALDTGELKHRFFGNHSSINPVRNQVAVENFLGEISVFDLDTGERKYNFIIRGGAALIRFNLQGNRLFVLSDLQSAYAFDLEKNAPPWPNTK